MSPLQRIGLGLIIVVIPADFPAQPHPAWNFYDLLPPPIGWLLVLSGLWRLSKATDLDLRLAQIAGVVALVVSIPLWFPQLNHYLVPDYNPGVSQSWQWLAALPSWAFGYFITAAVGSAALNRQPPERGLSSWFGLVRWGFVAAAILPAVVYGADLKDWDTPMRLMIGMVEICFIVGLFTYHRREWLGGPGPRVWITPEERAAARRGADNADGDAEPATSLRSDWEQFKAEREKAREEMRERRRERRAQAKRPE